MYEAKGSYYLTADGSRTFPTAPVEKTYMFISFHPGRWKVSTREAGNREPRWRRVGKELFILEFGIPTERLMSVSVRAGPHGEFQAGTPQALFEFRAIGFVPGATVSSIAPVPMGSASCCGPYLRTSCPR